MRVRLRPYHPTCVVVYFGDGGRKRDWCSVAFNSVIDIFKKYPDVEIEFVEEFDDICCLCERRKKDADGSVWGKNHSCPSSNSPQIVSDVKEQNRAVLHALELDFGSVIRLQDLVKLLRERIPNLESIGQKYGNERYYRGLSAIDALYE